jgi:acyl carrier protein
MALKHEIPFDHMEPVIAAIRYAGGDRMPKQIRREDSLVSQLGFDSVKIAVLSLALENELGVGVVLDPWVSAHADPHELTVGSLCDYIEECLRGSGPLVAAR